MVYKITKDEKYLNSALMACQFIKSMENRKGGFYFGYMKENSKWELFKYPIWVAASGDTIRSLHLMSEYKRFNLRNSIRWILKNTDINGGVRTSYGIGMKNKKKEFSGKPFWRDVLHVVGWNDKALRLFSILSEGLKPAPVAKKIEIECHDGLYTETEKLIRIEGDETWTFRKEKCFSNGGESFKRFALSVYQRYNFLRSIPYSSRALRRLNVQ